MSFFKYGALVQQLNSFASSGGTLTLVNNSKTYQRVTGTANHTIVLPDATTCSNGLAFTIISETSGTITVNNNGAVTLKTLSKNQSATFVVSDITNANGFSTAAGSSTAATAPGSNGGYNLLWNSNFSFETGDTSSWTASAGAFTVTSTAANVGIGTYSGSWVTGAGSQTLSSTLAAIPAGLYGQNGLAQVMLQTAATDFVLSVTDGTNTLASMTITGTGASQYSTYQLNFIFPSSGSIQLVLTSGSAQTVYIDNAYVGSATNLFQATPGGDLQNDLTWTFDNLGTTSNVDIRYQRDGRMMRVWGVVTLGTPATAVAAINLPSGLTIDSTRLTSASNIQIVGHIWRITTNTSFAGSYGPFAIFYDGSTTNKLFITNSGTATNVLQKRNADNLYTASGEQFSFEFDIPIASWTPQLAVTPQTSGQLWSGTATLSGTTASATFADLGSVSGTVTQVSSTNLSCVAATSLVGITCTPATAGVFEISTSGYITNTGNNQTYNQVTDGAGNVLGGLQNNTITAAGNATSLSSTVQYVAASTGPFTIKWQGKNNGGTNTHYLTSSSVRLVSQSIPAPILVGSVTSNTQGQERMESAVIGGNSSLTNLSQCTSDPCTVASQSGSWITASHRDGAGAYHINIASGEFSAIPRCMAIGARGTAELCNVDYTNGSTSSTLIYIACNSGGSATDGGFTMMCMGPK